MKVDRFYVKSNEISYEICDRCESTYSNDVVRIATDNIKFNRELAKLLLPVINDYYNGKLDIKEGTIERIKREIQSFINFWRK